MLKLYDLTDTELEVMEFFWGQKEPRLFSVTIEYFNTQKKKEWKKQTMNTYLNHLTHAGLLKAEKGPRARLYSAACTREDYQQQCARKLIERSFDNSLAKFIAAFTGGEGLSEEEAEELKKLI